eukprot:779329-Amphidinium_carterae.1
MPEVNGVPASQEETLGEELGVEAMAVEEARKRIHTQLDAGEDPLNPQRGERGPRGARAPALETSSQSQ